MKFSRRAKPSGKGRRPRRRVVVLLLVLLLAAVGGIGAYYGAPAALSGNRGKTALIRAEGHLRARDLDQARAQLRVAQQAFTTMGREIEGLGPLLPVARRVPLVGSQVAGAETLAETGVILSGAGLGLVDAAQEVLDGDTSSQLGSGLLQPLGEVRGSVQVALTSVEEATAKVSSLDDDWLVGPLGDAYDTLAERLPELRDGMGRTERGLGALQTFSGASGPRRYLFLSQNPDEIRPTGGFIGTYGVLTADAGELALERYESIQTWTGPRPEAVVPGEQAGSPFRFAQPPVAQTLGTVNNGPDWPSSARLAAELWRKGGEEPVDGVVSFVPSFLARLLVPLGPVEVPEYGETVTAANLAERFEHYTEQVEAGETTNVERKDFVASLAEVVMQRLLAAPASKWDDLAAAVGESFANRDAMAWSADEDVARSLNERDWDGTFPETSGDFFYNGEFSYAAKNGSGIRRSFDHHVEVRPDGSGLVTTEMALANTEEAGRFNTSSLSYVTIYGPSGASLGPGSDPPLSAEPTVAGHPAAGWLVAAPPKGRTSLTVAWEVPELLTRDGDGNWVYGLTWLHLPGHTGDTLELDVELPQGWDWAEQAPPATVGLDQDFAGTWPLTTASPA